MKMIMMMMMTMMMKWILVVSVAVVTVTSGLDRPSLNCDFESSLCDWTADSSSSYIMWNRRRGESESRYSGPRGDHTTGNGYFMVMQTHRYATARLSLRSPLVSSTSDTCLTFWYQMHGYDVGGLSVTRHEWNKEKKLFRKFGPQGDRWYKAYVNTSSGTNFQIVIQASYYDGYMGLGDIAIDDIAFSYDGPCRPDDSEKTKNEPRFNCDFEENFCSWHCPTKGQTGQWVRSTVSSNSSVRNELPSHKQVTTYSQIPKHRKSEEGNQQVILRSPTVSIESKGGCLDLWYKFNDSNANELSVLKFDYGESLQGKPEVLFQVQTVQGQAWNHQHVTVPGGYNMYIVFSARYDPPGNGILAIDDVTLKRDGPCTEDTDQVYADCDFEQDLCRWFMTTSKDEDDWVRNIGPTPTNNTGPSHDHTSGSGYYLYLDGATVREAKLFSPTLATYPTGACLRFWYHMDGEDVDVLQLSLYERQQRTLFRPSSERVLLSIEGEQGDGWMQSNVSIPATRNAYLVFKATRGYFPASDIAIDDVTISFRGFCDGDDPIEPEPTPSALPVNNSREIWVLIPTNASSVSQNITELTELKVPSITVQSIADPAFVDSRVEIHCGHFCEGLRYFWYRSHGKTYQEIKNEDNPSLLFEEVQFNDAGRYKCGVEAEGHLITMSDSVDITVGPDPRPRPHLTNDSLADPALINSDITLTCGKHVKRGVYHWRTDSPVFASSPIPSSQVLLLSNVNQSHSGNYSCRISKDELSTSRSNTVRVRVVPGKYCTGDHECAGNTYLYNCLENRCLCSVYSVLLGRGCRERPQPPTIRPWPRHGQYLVGETIYLLCDFVLPSPTSMTFTFMRSGRQLPRDHTHHTYRILRIANATVEDSGVYQCFVTLNEANSYTSRPIRLVVKEFVNLNCDFNDGFCEWLHGSRSQSVNFTLQGEATHAIALDNSTPGPSGAYIRLNSRDPRQAYRGVLRSPTINQTDLDSCLTFWYRMHGPGAYSLTVLKYRFSTQWNEDAGKDLWTAIGDHGDTWHPGKVTIPGGDNFYIQFEGIGALALDDIVFTYREKC